MRSVPVCRSILLAACAGALPVVIAAQEARDETAILFSKIPTVHGASRFDQLASEAPASVSVVTAEEIARHGWRTLAEVVSSVRGFFTTYDRAYTYVAARGFGRPGDYSNRVLLLLDGRAVNEPIYGGGAYGTESVVDVADIDRVEVIRGPGSSLYGASAFFGVISVITRRGRDLAGGRVRAIAASYATSAAQGSLGKRFGSGLELLVSGQLYRQRGQEHFYPEFDSPASHNGLAEFDRDERQHLLAKLTRGNLTVEGVFNNREKQVPTASFGTLFNDPRARVRDAEGFLAADWRRTDQDGQQSAAGIGYHWYSYQGGFPQSDGFYDDASRGRWLDAEASLLRPLRGRQKLMIGGEYRLHLEQQQTSGKTGEAPSLFNNTRNDVWALYFQDELRLGRLILNAGARFDHYGTFGGVLSPRAALVYGWEAGSAKLLYGRAFRAPSNFEMFYQDGYSIKASPDLDPEHIVTVEAVLEQRLGSWLRAVLSAYQYRAHGLISEVLDSTDGMLSYRNADEVQGRGIEAELELELPIGLARASYALQRSQDEASGMRLTNSPAHLFQFTLSGTLVPERVTAGFALQAMSARRAPSGATAPAFATGSLVLRGRRLAGGLGAVLGVYNLWNRGYSDPVGAEHLQPVLRQDGRQVRATLQLEF